MFGTKLWLFLWIFQLFVLAPLNVYVISTGNTTHWIFLGMNIVFGALAWFFWKMIREDDKFEGAEASWWKS